ncbi:MAG: hypothetical protein JWL61_1820 [Gemmatimonadetes bacterium]|nr:hypothetical protein [Gemmatimonadota bacterium]
MSEGWSRIEVEAIVADYLIMLEQELNGLPFNKAAHNRQLTTLLNNRSRGAVEFKYANISAALIDLDYPYIKGYQPRSNYQDVLLEVLADRVDENVTLKAAVLRAVGKRAQTRRIDYDYSSILVPPPTRERDRKTWMERRQPVRRPRRDINFLELEARNASLGQAGEQFIAHLEHRRLWSTGQKRLAERVEHVSRTRGDGLGYDILSYEPSGRERFIEVKTTRFGAMIPFFVTRNEVQVSEEEAANFHLCRVFKFDDHPPQVYTLPGALRLSFVLDAVQYEASLP